MKNEELTTEEVDEILNAVNAKENPGCASCRWLYRGTNTDFRTQLSCHAPANRYISKEWYGEMELSKAQPSDLNKNRSCPYFEEPPVPSVGVKE